MFGDGITTVGFKNHIDGRQAFALLIGDRRSHLEQQLRAGHAEGVRGAIEHFVRRTRLPHPLVQTARSLHPALQAGATEGKGKILGTQGSQHFDDGVLAKIGGIGERRSPVAFHAARIFFEKPRIARSPGRALLRRRRARWRLSCGRQPPGAASAEGRSCGQEQIARLRASRL